MNYRTSATNYPLYGQQRLLPLKHRKVVFMPKLKFLRTELQISQWELASASGVPRWAIQLIEAGVRLPSSREAMALAEALGSPVEQLFPALSEKSQNEATKEE